MRILSITGVEVVAVLTLLLGVSGCGVYSFTGASIPPEAKTISIEYFKNNADLIEPTLAQQLTDDLRNRFTGQTSLVLVDRDGDLQLEGEITGYKVTPRGIQSDDQSALNRLTITVKVSYANTIDPSKDFETSFSRFEDYNSDIGFSAVKDGLIVVINEQLVEDIFNKAVVNW